MKNIVVYNSKTGFTKKYAEWIAEELGCDILTYKEFLKSGGGEAAVIFGSRVHAGRISKLPKIKKVIGRRADQKLIVFATGATPIAAEDVVAKIWSDNLTDAEKEAIPHFYFQSGLDYGKMGFFDRLLMKLAAKLMGGKKDKTDTEAGFVQSIKESHDISSKEYIAPLVRFIKGDVD